MFTDFGYFAASQEFPLFLSLKDENQTDTLFHSCKYMRTILHHIYITNLSFLLPIIISPLG